VSATDASQGTYVPIDADTELNHQPTRMLGYLLSGSEAQRDAVADEMDNDLIQIAAALEVRMGILARTTAHLEDESLRRTIEDARQSVRELRCGLRRAVLLLGSAHSRSGDLEAALRDLGVRASMGTNLRFSVQVEIDEAPPSTISGVLYRVVQESVSSALNSPDASSISVEIEMTDDEWVVRVVSDGHSHAEVTEAKESVVRSTRRLSEYLAGMNGRVVGRTRGQGTRVVEAFIPIGPGDVPAWLDLAADAQLVLDALSLGVLVVTREWRVLFANNSGAGLLGRRPGQVEGQLLWDLSEDFRAPKFRALLMDALAGQYAGHFTPESDLPIKRVWFDPSPFGTLLQFDEEITD